MPTALDVARRIGPELVALRRRLHRAPEIGLHLPGTQAAVLEALAGLDLEVTTGPRAQLGRRGAAGAGAARR